MSEYENIKDEKIAEMVRSSDKNLYAILIERYKNKLLRYANHLVHDENKATHIVQDSFIKAYINLNGFDSNKNFSSWIYRIVHNEAINSLTKDKREMPMPEDFDIESEEDITKDFEDGETVAKVEKCMSQISIMYREPLSLYYLDNKSYEEISDILRIPMGTVATRISRAKKIMRKICQKN